MKKSLTLIVSVYNAARYLELLFAALARQSFTDFEVIVADDGSGEEVAALIEGVKSRASYNITHVWHEDRGWRKNAILNKSISSARTDYLVFIDGDCIPHKHFLRDHHASIEHDAVLCGRRVNLSKEITAGLTIPEIQSGRYERFTMKLLLDGIMARSYNLEDAIRIESGTLRRLLHRNQARILGCNFSVEKSLLEQINGFNEEYHGPGLGEDSDIAFRLELIGARLKTLRYQAVLYHLYHPTTNVGEGSKQLFDQVVTRREAVCRHGLKNLTNETVL